jgi:hypothetical protein
MMRIVLASLLKSKCKPSYQQDICSSLLIKMATERLLLAELVLYATSTSVDAHRSSLRFYLIEMKVEEMKGTWVCLFII